MGSGGVIVRIGFTKRPISIIALPYSSYASASTLRVAGDLPAGPGVIVHTPEIVAVRHRSEGAVERQDLETVTREVELADDLRSQQRHHVRADGVLEAGEDLLGHRRPAEHVPPLDHEHLAARLRQIGRVDEPVVAAADHDHVVVGHKIQRGCASDRDFLTKRRRFARGLDRLGSEYLSQVSGQGRPRVSAALSSLRSSEAEPLAGLRRSLARL